MGIYFPFRNYAKLMLFHSHIIHIDFGFMLSKKQIRLLNVNFETAPFKLTQEFIEVMGGIKSSSFKHYKHLMQKGTRKFGIRFIVNYFQVTASWESDITS